MKLIVGLGNPGPEYANTRHNAGWLALDYLVEQRQLASWRSNKKLDALTTRDFARDLVLAKPTTMMNNSGFAVQKLLNYYELGIRDLLVIHDDADLDFGEIREAVASKTGAGHHGVLSVVDHVGPGFERLRIGIGRPDQPARDIGSYVLGRLTKEEAGILMSRVADHFGIKSPPEIGDGKGKRRRQ